MLRKNLFVGSLQTICKPAPYSTDLEAVAERDACDYTQRISLDMAKGGTCTRKIRIYTDGIYDLFHQGHARQMMQAKNIFPKSQIYLIIGACNDDLTHSLKGRTVMTDVERYEAIRHCRYVDEIIRDAPWQITDEFMEKHKIDFVAQDSTPYVSDDCDDLYKEIKEKGYFVATERTEGTYRVESTELLTKFSFFHFQAFPHPPSWRGSSRTTICMCDETSSAATPPRSSTFHS